MRLTQASGCVGNAAGEEKDTASDLNAIGVSFLKNGDFERAAHYYQRAIKRDPEHANSLGNYANLLHYIKKDYDQACPVPLCCL